MRALDLDPPFRLAVAADGPALAQFVFMASEGLSLVVWTALAREEGVAADRLEARAWEIGAERQAARAESGGVVVIDEGAGAIAGLTGYVVGSEPEPLDAVTPLFRPLVELENLALDSWYVNVLAVAPDQRRRGWGARLIGLAERAAAVEGLGRLSLIVSDDHVAARRLYERLGFEETATRPAVQEGWDGPTTAWSLMMKRL